MSLANEIRLTRFYVKDDTQVRLTIVTKSGQQLALNVRNCSINGIAAALDPASVDTVDEWLTEEDIVPVAKLNFDDSEVSLGRLVVKRITPKEAGSLRTIGFGLVDTKLPVDGKLSKHFHHDFNKPKSPYEMELGSNQFTLANFVTENYANVDLFDRTKKFKPFVRDWEKSEKFGYFLQRDSSAGPRIQIARKRSSGRTDYLMMGSNDYLGLASHPAVKETAIKAIQEYGFGSTGSAHTAGNSVLHEKLIERLATMFRREDAMLFASGYAANIGIITGLCREQDLIVGDMLCHASIQDGMGMSKATCRFYKHNDMNHLRQILAENRHQYSGCLIVTEGAFSMDGTIGKLDEIYKIAREFNARVMIDQAHCVGVVGQHGLGTVEKYNLVKETDVIMGLFSKSFGAAGGFVVGDRELIDWLRYFSRAYIFSTSFPPVNAAVALKSIELMEKEGLVEKLQNNIDHFVTSMRQIGAQLDPAHETAIVPVEIRNEEKMGKMFQSLLESGIFAIPVVYPVVSRTRCRFRFSIRADFTVADLDYVVTCFEKAMAKAEFKFGEPSPDDKKNDVKFRKSS